jgi:hypothetical protein
MNELEYFYNNHFKTPDMMDWTELTDKQKKTLENCGQYSTYKLKEAIINFQKAAAACRELAYVRKKIGELSKLTSNK